MSLTAVSLLFSIVACVQVSLALPSVQENWGPGYTYLLFAAIGVVSLVVLNSIVPETKGRTLEEIEADWDLDKSS